jgi:hypothetical protein
MPKVRLKRADTRKTRLPKAVEARYSASATARHPIVALIRTSTVYARHIVQRVLSAPKGGSPLVSGRSRIDYEGPFLADPGPSWYPYHSAESLCRASMTAAKRTSRN